MLLRLAKKNYSFSISFFAEVGGGELANHLGDLRMISYAPVPKQFMSLILIFRFFISLSIIYLCLHF